ncbi:MAG: glutaredoxin family protein [Candidatus Berkiella sp.]
MITPRTLFIRLAILLSFVMAIMSPPLVAKETSVVLYGTSTCGYCKQAREYLRSHGVSFKDYDIENSDEAKNKFQELNGQGVPLILVGKTRLDGFDREDLHTALVQNGILNK